MFVCLKISGPWTSPESRRYESTRGFLLLGRGETDLRVIDPFCSKVHAMLYVNNEGQLFIKDLRSKNKTYVDGQSVQDRLLYPGAKIKLGRTLIVIREFGNMHSPRVTSYTKLAGV